MNRRFNVSLAKAKLAELNITQEELAKRAGVDATTVSHWLNGKRQPLAESYQRLAKALNVDVEELSTDDNCSVLVTSPHNIIIVNNSNYYIQISGGSHFVFAGNCSGQSCIMLA